MDAIVQGTPEWHAVRLGKVTASRVADVVARTKTGPSASRANYMADLIAERLTGEAREGFKSAEMQWGNDHEQAARAAYQFHANRRVEQVGFVPHPTIGMTGASPDGLVGDDGLVEIKCPNTATHLDTLLGDAVAGKYVTQMQWQMACTGRAWCDFASFDPRLPEPMQLFVRRVSRDEKHIAELQQSVMEFLTDLAMKEHQLRRKFGMDASIAEVESLLMAR